MRKYTLGLAAAVAFGIILSGGTAKAAMLGGLAEPLDESQASLSLTLGYSQRDVKDGDVKDEASSRRFLFKGAYGLGKSADVYAFAGLTDIAFKEADFDGSLGESFGAGFHYSPVEFQDGTKVIFDFQGEYAASDEGNTKVTYQAFRAAAYIGGKFGSSGKFGFFFPYAGLALSSSEYKVSGGDDAKGEGNIGLIAGTDFFVSPNIFLSMEFHLFDENAAFLTSGYKF